MLFAPHDPNDGPSVWRDLIAGKLGFPSRLSLSFVAAIICTACFMFCMAALESGGNRVRDESIVVGLGLAGIAWIALLLWIWRGYAKFRRVIRATFICLIIWAIAITLSVIVSLTTFQEEFWIAGLVFAGFAGTFAVVTSAAYKGSAGRAITTVSGSVHVLCADCGYSLVGKNDCTCPECGRKYTIDELIRLQDYDAVRKAGLALPVAPKSGARPDAAALRLAPSRPEISREPLDPPEPTGHVAV